MGTRTNHYLTELQYLIEDELGPDFEAHAESQGFLYVTFKLEDGTRAMAQTYFNRPDYRRSVDPRLARELAERIRSDFGKKRTLHYYTEAARAAAAAAFEASSQPR